MKQQTSPQSQQTLTISAKELAQMLGVSTRQIWRLNSEHLLPEPVRLGRLVRWDKREVLDWLKEGCVDRDTWSKKKPYREVMEDIAHILLGISTSSISNHQAQQAIKQVERLMAEYANLKIAAADCCSDCDSCKDCNGGGCKNG